MLPRVASFYHAETSTFTHVVYDRDGGRAAIIDPVLDFELASARTSTAMANRVLELVIQHELGVDWILETHAHADHLSAAAHLKVKTGATVAIGRGICQVQSHFKALFGLEEDFPVQSQSSVRAQRSGNIHVDAGTSEESFVRICNARDAALPVPRLMLVALQVNIRAGNLPQGDIRCLRLPLDQLVSASSAG
jgi:hypothetical protein